MPKLTDAERVVILHAVLKRIASYQTPAQLQRGAQREYGLPYEEALEYAYENVLSEAKSAVKTVRIPKPKTAESPETKPEAETPKE